MHRAGGLLLAFALMGLTAACSRERPVPFGISIGLAKPAPRRTG